MVMEPAGIAGSIERPVMMKVLKPPKHHGEGHARNECERGHHECDPRGARAHG